MSGNHKRWTAVALAGGLAALVALAGCGGNPSVASKSAPAFREAQKKGETVEDAAGSHGHGALIPAGGHDAMEQQEGQNGMPDMDHGAMGHEAGKDGMAGMDHAAAPAAAAPLASSPGQPARTLSSDPLDAPAATSVLDAQRSVDMANGMEHGGHGEGTYRQVDAGRGPGAYQGSEEQAPGAGTHQHGQDTAPPSGQEEAAAVYTCPMHPEVTSKTPGKCPKCGMTLVKRRKG